MDKYPLNIDSTYPASDESIAELHRMAFDVRSSDPKLAMHYIEKAVRMALGLSLDADIYKALCEKSYSPIKDKKLLGNCLHLLAWLDVEFSRYDNAILSLVYAKEIFKEVNDKDAFAKLMVVYGSVYVLKGEFQKALEYNLEGLKAAEVDKNIENITTLLSNTGLTYWNLGENVKAYEYISKSLKYKREKGDSLDIAKSLNNLGLVYNAMGDYLNALEAYQEAFSIVERFDEKKGIGILYMNIALIYERLGEPLKAENFLYKALEAYKSSGYQKGIGECLVNIALILRILHRYDEAFKYANESYETASKLGDKKVIAFAYQEIMNLLFVEKKYNQALEYALKCYELRNEIGHKPGVIEICGSIGEILIELDRADEALHFFEKAIDIGTYTGIKKDLLFIYSKLSAYYEKKNDYKKALDNLKKFVGLRDIVFDEDSQNKIRVIQARFEVEQAQRESEIYKLKNIDLAEANKKLEVMNQEKNEFLNLVSHDLKNPLNSIFGFSTLLVEDAAMLSKEEVSDFAANINISSMAMLDLINEILNSDLMDSGRYQVKNELVDLNSIINSLIGMNKFQLKHKEIKVVFEESSSSHLFSDGNILKQIISNLFSNAIKFSMPGSNVYLNIYHNENKSSTFIEVKDEGPGLTPEDKEKLFVKFAKLSAQPTAGESSTGLGLSIVKKLTDIIGGVIICESEPGKGTKFTVEVPLTPSKK
ncbi:MAG: tetratricopeptide repeat-containing sensor histidine kinase [Ignavibacteria bacterium]|nr:tetratricopeptide repeat-containing sensor histidine kinase [Ignavibacteria bacterium]